MFRRDLIELLAQPRRLHDLAREREAKVADVEDDLRHLLKTLKHSQEYRAVVTPARCRHCGFIFDRDKLTKPGKCPQCRSTWIEAPLIRIEKR